MKVTTETFPKFIRPLLRYFHVDFDPPRPPSRAELILA